MKKRSLIGLSLAFLTPLMFAGCLFFESGGSPTDPNDDDAERPDEDDEGDDVALVAPADLSTSPLDGLVHFV